MQSKKNSAGSDKFPKDPVEMNKLAADSGSATATQVRTNTAPMVSQIATTYDVDTTAQTRNIECALTFINCFASGDIGLAAQLVTEDYVEHNLLRKTGRSGLADFMEQLVTEIKPTTVENIRAYADGDKVWLHSVYNFAGAGEQIVFDVFKFDADGIICEHWDNICHKEGMNPSGHNQIDGPTMAIDLDKTEANRQLVAQYIADVLEEQNPDNIHSFFADGAYIQHNIGMSDGVYGIKTALDIMEKQGVKIVYAKTHMLLAQGNYVLGVCEGSCGGFPTSYYDLWRVENGKICEHWDIVETIADKSEWQNDNGKF